MTPGLTPPKAQCNSPALTSICGRPSEVTRQAPFIIWGIGRLLCELKHVARSASSGSALRSPRTPSPRRIASPPRTAIQCSIFTATCPNLKQESLIGNAPGSLFVGGHNAPERLHEQTAHLVDLSGDVGPRFSHLIGCEGHGRGKARAAVLSRKSGRP